MTAIYDQQEHERNIRHARQNQSKKMSELLLPDLKPPSKINELRQKNMDKIRAME